MKPSGLHLSDGGGVDGTLQQFFAYFTTIA